MPVAIVSPSDLRAFARHLEHSARQITSKKVKVTQLVSDTRSVWKDQKYEHFRKVFDQTVKDLDHFVRLANDYSQFLQDKARLGERYLDNR
jgi:hypothetical protein